MQHILIVDDQRDIRQMLRAGVETLGADLQVTDVPSGEEALLVISNQPVDLLVSDVYLPGISGLDLINRAQARKPGLRVILITGVDDPAVRQAVEEARAAFYFYKPVDMDAFLTAVQTCLNLADADILSESEELERLAQQLENLRQEMDLQAVGLLSAAGRVLAQSGGFSAFLENIQLRAAVLSALRAGGGVAQRLEDSGRHVLMHFPGKDEDLVALQVPGADVLIASTRPPLDSHRVAQIAAALQQVQTGTRKVEPAAPPEDVVLPPEEAPAEEEVSTDLPDVSDLFSLDTEVELKPEEVDAFWENLAEKTEFTLDEDAIPYEQALDLGLAPGLPAEDESGTVPE
ncbi:MAG: response regulator [Chloroflexi bacterium]|jgi:DNA-binding response OmpR family regulator|nr:response regulator [Chloroflexota bacterium]